MRLRMAYKFTTDKISIDIYQSSAQKYCIIKETNSRDNVL